MLLDLGDLHIRPWRKSDMDALLRHANNPKIAANLRDQFPHPYTRRDALDYLNYVRDDGRSHVVCRGVRRRGHRRDRVQTGVPTSHGSASRWAIGSGSHSGAAASPTRAVMASSEWAFDAYKVVRIFATVFVAQHGVDSSAGKIRVRAQKVFCAAAPSRTARFSIRSCTPKCDRACDRSQTSGSC